MNTEHADVAVPALYQSVVTHVRTHPLHSGLTHRTYLWLIDVDRPPRLPFALRPLARFEGRDHFGGRTTDIRSGLEHFLSRRGVALDGGRVLMLAHARVLGYVFNPLSVFWCHGPDGELRCVVAEVHNTYGERHCYLLRPDAVRGAEVPKELYVSPFFSVEGDYRMRLPLPAEHLGLTVRLDQGGIRKFTATVHGERRAATAAALLRAVARRPWSTVAVSAAIRRHGIVLWLRGLPVHIRPRRLPQEGLK
ncbi:DUF1365 domain-containing protein [Streptomyces sp. NPDC050658]|uniref:DUF1365 domain-containing protein n=1 Tax=unclassified Streptomyces TaxID=2593676 RepID=UPI0034162478